MSEFSLRLSNISKSFPGVRALTDTTIECRAGEVHAILGENGSGKSTLLGIASGALSPDAGTIEIMGKPLAAGDPRMARALGLATVYQDDSLVRELTVAQNLFLSVVDDEVSYATMNEWAERRLADYDLALPPARLVGDLTPAERQFLEIVKALISRPQVLLLDEPTSTLDRSGVSKLGTIVRRLVREGVAIIYVSHRLPEILDMADRVTVLRDGIGQGTFAIDESLSENDLVALMVGRPIDVEYPAKGSVAPEHAVLSVDRLSGDNFRDVSFSLRRGEILGFAGAEGNGQRDALRCLAGLVEGTGDVVCNGRTVDLSSPRSTLDKGLVFLSADRLAESIFPELGVRENITVQVLDRYSKVGFVSARAERAEAQSLVDAYAVVASSLDSAIAGLSGGNQQKSVLARSFALGADVFLFDEPTQGVDAGSRFEIYRAIRENVSAGTGCIVNSSDALELAGICDRVLVFSRGRIVRELAGADVTEANIVSSFLTARDADIVPAEAEAGPERSGRLGRVLAILSSGSGTWWLPLVFLLALTVLVGGYATSQSDVFLRAINLRHILLAAAPMTLVAMAQFNVLLVRGFDISVGSMMSLTVVIASFLIASQMGPTLVVLGAVGCLLAGLVVGGVNGWMVRYVGVNAVITTIAMLSILQGIALVLRPTPGGLVNPDFTALLAARVGPIPISFVAIVALAVAGDLWLHRTRSGLRVQAVGFRELAATRNGVRANLVQVRAYLSAALLAAIAGLFLASEVGVGTPTIGSSYTLTSIAAAVLGGAALTGGRGSFLGTYFGALFFTLTVNVISLLGMDTAVGIIVSGALTLLAVFFYSSLGPTEQLVRRLLASVRRSPAV